MPGQKRKADDMSSQEEIAPSKRIRSSDEETDGIMAVSFGASTAKVYDTVTFESKITSLSKESTKDSTSIATDEPMDEDGDSKAARPKRKPRAVKPDPVHSLGDGTRVAFNTGFVLQRDGDNYKCTCPVFKDNSIDIRKTTCEHLQEYLGCDYERWRVNASAPVIRNHINVSVLLAQKYEEEGRYKIDPKGWWLSEKLDGVRAFWNGRCFYSRLGNAFHAPSGFTKDLPRDMTLDGELFGGRGQFQDTVKIVKSGPENPDWNKIKFHIFDCPSLTGERFEKRSASVIAMFHRKRPAHAVFVSQTKCKNKGQLDEMCDRILSLGGEGVMLREPQSYYEECRSWSLRKMKKFYDAEAEVIGRVYNGNITSALRCRMECGKEFKVGSGLSNKDRLHPPKIGTIISYKFQELTKSGCPRFPSFLGVRIDMTSPKDAEIREIIDE